jgi:hypothetical protein
VCGSPPGPCALTPAQGASPGTVQVPTSRFVLNVAVLPNGRGVNFGCSGLANYGIRVDIKYQVLDQNGNPILLANMPPHELGTFFDGGGYTETSVPLALRTVLSPPRRMGHSTTCPLAAAQMVPFQASQIPSS